MNNLKNWEDATEALTAQFVAEVFPYSSYIPEWVCNEIGTIFEINDYWVDLNRVVEYFRYKATPEQFFEYYDRESEMRFLDMPVGISFKNFVKYGWMK